MPKQPPTLRTARGPARPPDGRPAPSRRGYGRRWQRARLAHLADHPLCAVCLPEGRTTAATEVDHVTAIAAGGEVFETANLMSLCKPCHSRKTVRVDGGLGHRPGSEP